MNYEIRTLDGRLSPLRPRRPPPYFRISLGPCGRPCACDGFEVCLHQVLPCVRRSIWPVFSAATEAETRKIHRELSAFARTLDPSQQEEPALRQVLETWATGKGWARRNHAVWADRPPLEGVSSLAGQ